VFTVLLLFAPFSRVGVC